MLLRVIRTTRIASSTIVASSSRANLVQSRLTQRVASGPFASATTPRVSIAAMSTSNSTPNPNLNQPAEAATPATQAQGEAPPASHDQQPHQENTIPLDRALPAPGENDSDGAVRLDLSGGGATVKFDALGPLVIHQDGTASRISNWSEMTEIERENTLRVLGKRNRTRLAALKEQGQEFDLNRGQGGQSD